MSNQYDKFRVCYVAIEKVLSQLSKRLVEPGFVKLNGERGLFNTVKILGPGVRRLVGKNHVKSGEKHFNDPAMICNQV